MFHFRLKFLQQEVKKTTSHLVMLDPFHRSVLATVIIIRLKWTIFNNFFSWLVSLKTQSRKEILIETEKNESISNRKNRGYVNLFDIGGNSMKRLPTSLPIFQLVEESSLSTDLTGKVIDFST